MFFVYDEPAEDEWTEGDIIALVKDGTPLPRKKTDDNPSVEIYYKKCRKLGHKDGTYIKTVSFKEFYDRRRPTSTFTLHPVYGKAEE